MTKQKCSKILAGILALILVVSILPMNMLTPVFAVGIESYTVCLTDGENVLKLDDVNITLTNKDDAAITKTAATIDGVATFESFAEEGVTYILAVETVVGYEDVVSSEITVAEGGVSTNIVLNAIEKVTVSGTVTDENGAAYEGAAVKISGYVTAETISNENGKYSFETYKGKENKISITAKEEKYNVISSTAAYSADESNANYQLSVKTFSVETGVVENGVITPSDLSVPYGSDKEVQITANTGYRIKEVKVNGAAVTEAANKQSHTVFLSKIKENYDITVSFYRMTYKVTFTVGENGEVTYGEGTANRVAGGSVSIEKTFEESTDSDNPTTVTIVAKPSADYRVSKVTLDNSTDTFTENDYEYKKENLVMTTDHTFVVEFSINEYKVTLDTVENGSVELSTFESGSNTSVTVKHGNKVFVQAKPDDGYELSGIKVGDTAVTFEETRNGYETEGTEIAADTKVYVTFVEKEECPDGSYKIEYSGANKTVNKITYMPDGDTVKFTPVGDYIRVRINGDMQYSGSSVSVKVGKKGDVQEITSIEVSTKQAAGWTKKKDVNITYDDTKPTISKIKNEGQWFKDAATYSFTVADTASGVKEVKYASVNDVKKAMTITPDSNDTYSFKVTDEFNGNYHIWVVDYCNNTLEAVAEVKIDKTPPVVTGFNFEKIPNSAFQQAISFISLGTFFPESLNVTVTAEDAGNSDVYSDVKTITLYADGKPVGTATVKDGKAVFKITQSDFEKAEISATVKDNAGNDSKIAKPSNEDVTSNAKSNMVYINADSKTSVEVQIGSSVTAGSDNVKYQKESSSIEWYANEKVTLNLALQDKVVGLQKVAVKINGTDITTTDSKISKLNEKLSKEQVLDKENLDLDIKAYLQEGENKVTVTVTNNANMSVTKDYFFHVDKTAPAVIKYHFESKGDTPLEKALNFLTFGIFFNEKIEITVTAAENNKDTNANAGIKSITLFYGEESITASGKDITIDEQEGNAYAKFILPVDEIGENFLFSREISAKATDFVGNVTENAVHPHEKNSDIADSNLMIETIKPTISVGCADAAYTKNAAASDKEDWYKEDIEFTVDVADADAGIRSVNIGINGTTLVDEDLNKTNKTKVRTKQYKVKTSDTGVLRDADGSYTIEVVVTDNAGNVSETYSKTIYKDIDKPYITGFDFDAVDFVEGSETASTVEVTDYGFYFKADTKVTISAKDNAPSAGVKSITYYTVDKDNGKSAEITDDVNEDGQIEFTIEASFKGQIYAKATDNVDNAADQFVNPNSAIVEDETKHREETHIIFTKDDTEFTINDGTNKELYANDVPVRFTVIDTYSGIRSIEWSVVAPYDTENNQNGQITVNNDKTFTSDSEKGWTIVDQESNLITKMEKDIVVKNNSNNIIVKVTMTDRAGNTTTDEIKFSIDKTEPIIEVTYDNNDADEDYQDFYKADREATVTIKERNFRAEDVVFAITNTDKAIPNIDLKDTAVWTTTENKDNPDATTHVAKFKYTAEGDYTFDISYKDNAENQAEQFTQHKFTIDKTLPEISVVYDNNAGLNGNYYKADRTATITIKEHNFDSARVNVIGTATDNDVAATFPTTSAWTDNGDDTYTAAIAYTTDAKYSFDIEFHDKAGNSIADYTVEEFYVDKTAPNLEITGVADKSANNGDIVPVITYSDTNFNKDNVTITLTGVNNGKVEYRGSYADIANGQTYTYANFEKVQSVDDIYTLTASLTDFAGNETAMTISFSANRFGSVYDLSNVKNVLGKYLQNEQDIVFTETNVDSLEKEGILIKLTKNGTPTTLIEGTDYTVDVAGGNGQWSVYTYTISKKLFSDDGTYGVSIYSKDAAGNVNENIDETKEAEISFGIDKTKPFIVPIDLESGKQYPVEEKEVSVEIKDNLVLESVKIYLNDEEIEYAANEETYSFSIPESNSLQNVRIMATDAAGNEYELAIEDFLVSTNIFARWYNNTPFFIGSIAGVAVLTLGGISFALFGKKKKKVE